MTLGSLRAWMEAAGVDSTCVTNPVSIGYLTGFFADPHERLMALAVPAGEAVLVVPALEAANAGAAAPGLEVRPWSDGEDPFSVLAAALGPARRLGVEKDHLTVARAERLLGQLPGASAVDAAVEIRRLRTIKTGPELDRLAEAGRLTDRLVERALAGLTTGVSELGVASLVAAATSEMGARPSFPPLVQFGPAAALPHHGPDGRRLEAGQLALLDVGASFEGYAGDITRVGVAGEPSRRQLEVHGAVLAGHDAAIAAVRAGVTAGEVDAAARQVIAAAGFQELFIHRTGHGLGLEAHEDPSLEGGSDQVLEAGMVITIEPGVYLPGWGGVRIEDMVVVEPSGSRLLTAAERELRIVPAT